MNHDRIKTKRTHTHADTHPHVMLVLTYPPRVTTILTSFGPDIHLGRLGHFNPQMNSTNISLLPSPRSSTTKPSPLHGTANTHLPTHHSPTRPAKASSHLVTSD